MKICIARTLVSVVLGLLAQAGLSAAVGEQQDVPVHASTSAPADTIHHAEPCHCRP